MILHKAFCPQISQICADGAVRFDARSPFHLRNLRNLRNAFGVLR
jgi:hypothetical protein